MNMEKKPSNLPIIDTDINKVFTKDSNKILKELLDLFIKETPKLQAEINLAFRKKQQKKLDDQLHKLLGSCAYCGWLRLKVSVVALKNAIAKRNYCNELLEEFNLELEVALAKAKEITHSY
jgi:HPt (histidine-containing phosphotransfer) domain-containing protein